MKTKQVQSDSVRYEVLDMTVGGENIWTEGDEPLTFATREEAQAEIDEHIQDYIEDFINGDRDCPDDPDDYCIVEVQKKGLRTMTKCARCTEEVNCEPIGIDYPDVAVVPICDDCIVSIRNGSFSRLMPADALEEDPAEPAERDRLDEAIASVFARGPVRLIESFGRGK